MSWPSNSVDDACLSEAQLEAATTTSTAAAAAPTASSSASGAATSSATSTTIRLLAGLVLGLGSVVDQQGVEGQRVGQDVEADGGATDVDCVEGDCVAALGSHLDGAQGRVHLRRDGSDGAVDDGAFVDRVRDAVRKGGVHGVMGSWVRGEGAHHFSVQS